MIYQNYNVDSYRCNEWDLQVKTIMILKKHMIWQNYNISRSTCNKYDSKVETIILLKKHMRNITYKNYTVDRYNCNECDIKVKTIMLLKKHMINITIIYIAISVIIVTLTFKLYGYWRNIQESYDISKL